MAKDNNTASKEGEGNEASLLKEAVAKVTELEQTNASLLEENDALKALNEELLETISEADNAVAKVDKPSVKIEKGTYEITQESFYFPAVSRVITAAEIVADKVLAKQLLDANVGFLKLKK